MYIECHLHNHVPSFFTRASRSSRKKGTRTLVRLVNSCLDACSRASAHSPVAISLRQTKLESLPSDISSSISEPTEDEIQAVISGLAGDAPRRDSFFLSFARVLIGGTLNSIVDGLIRTGMYFDRASRSVRCPACARGKILRGVTFWQIHGHVTTAADPTEFSSRRLEYCIITVKQSVVILFLHPFFYRHSGVVDMRTSWSCSLCVQSCEHSPITVSLGQFTTYRLCADGCLVLDVIYAPLTWLPPASCFEDRHSPPFQL